MITVRIKGGLGNQLFQYASGYALARRLDQELQLDATFFPAQTLRGFKLGSLAAGQHGKVAEKQSFVVELYKNRYLNKLCRICNCRTLPCPGRTTFLLETRSDILPEWFTIHNDNLYVDGYYQSEKYFLHFRNEILKQFRPVYEMETEYLETRNQIEGCNAVAVHVRRGDFLMAQNDSNPNHYLLGEQYYHNAVRYMEEHLGNPVFFWFSDDIGWVRQNFGKRDNFRFVSMHTRHADIDEMMLMKNCRHIIAANSTFSWWASWLNEHGDAIHLCPAKRYGNLYMIPENWVKIPVQ